MLQALPGVDEKLARFAGSLLRGFGINKPVLMGATKDIRRHYGRFGVDPSVQAGWKVRGAEADGPTASWLGRTGPINHQLDAHILWLGDHNLRTNATKGLLKNKLVMVSVVAHEVGHIVQHELYEGASNAVKFALDKEWKAWARKYTKAGTIQVRTRGLVEIVNM